MFGTLPTHLRHITALRVRTIADELHLAHVSFFLPAQVVIRTPQAYAVAGPELRWCFSLVWAVDSAIILTMGLAVGYVHRCSALLGCGVRRSLRPVVFL